MTMIVEVDAFADAISTVSSATVESKFVEQYLDVG